MKYFTAPNGKFVIKVPVEWQYKNGIHKMEHASPFSFQLYDKPVGAFQISCYPIGERNFDPSIPIQKADTANLKFEESKMADDEFTCNLWFCRVEDHYFLAKYIFDPKKDDPTLIDKERRKAIEALSTLELISVERRTMATNTDKYEKFVAALAASFDLKNHAIESEAYIELIIIIANQIDAYLRQSLLMKKQLDLKTNEIDIAFLHQGDEDKAITERQIYKMSKDHGLVTQVLFDKLEALYKKRNKIVHRYIISDLNTAELLDIYDGYDVVCEEVRVVLKGIEDLQFKERIGIHGGQRDPREEHSEEAINFLMSLVNDKHLLTGLKRGIDETTPMPKPHLPPTT